MEILYFIFLSRGQQLNNAIVHKAAGLPYVLPFSCRPQGPTRSATGSSTERTARALRPGHPAPARCSAAALLP